MPTYDYECTACGYTFEEFQSMSDDPITKCPKCKKMKVRRLIGGGVGIIFKGSGFYVTDNKSASTPRSSKSKSEKKEDSKKESKDSKSESSKDSSKKEQKKTA